MRHFLCRNSIIGSAVCVFNMTAVNASFDGAFKYQASPSSTWGPVTADNHHFRCEDVETSMDADLAADKFQLMNQPILPETLSPIYLLNSEK